MVGIRKKQESPGTKRKKSDEPQRKSPKNKEKRRKTKTKEVEEVRKDEAEPIEIFVYEGEDEKVSTVDINLDEDSDSDVELDWDPEVSYVGIKIETAEKPVQEKEEEKVELEEGAELNTKRRRWIKKGAPILKRENIPKEWNWTDEEFDLDIE